MLTKLIAGDGRRKTRLHDELGERVTAGRLLRNGPRAVLTGAARLLLDARPALPWISYDAQGVIAGRLTPNSRVLEFGSGMSTLWYAAHAGEVVAIEDHRPWFDKVGDLIAGRGLRNVRYRFAADPGSYADVRDDERGDGFDLVMVDGSVREDCLRAGLPLLRPGGMAYLDNSDKGAGGAPGDVPAARRLLLRFAAERGGVVQHFTDFAPTQLFVQQGTLVTLPA